VLFGRLRIQGKLALLVLIPLLGVVALSVPIIANRIQAARDAQSTADTVELATQVGSAVQELQEERLLSTGYLLGLVQAPELVSQTTKAQDRLASLSRLDQPLSSQMRRAIANANRLNNTRKQVLNRTQRPDLLVSEFTGVVTPIIDALDLRNKADLKSTLGKQVFALDQALRSDDQISQASAYLTMAAVTKNTAFVGLFYSVLVTLEANIIGGQMYFTPEQYRLYLTAQEAVTVRTGPDFLTRAAVDPNAAVRLLDTKTIFGSLRSVNVLGGFVEKRIASDVKRAATNNRNDALRTAFIIAGSSLLLLLLVFVLSIFMARAVGRPLRRLTWSADRIARTAQAELERVADDDAESPRPIRLDPVDVAARDEIGDLARAFDRVQSTAVRLVERQVAGRRNVAQMFGHVGRRTQNLVGRQLALIDNLERRETDSDRLRELYRLDHMSSRLRRNASSLVVLSGAVGANEHMAPLQLSDVVRLALGEIEDYTRVDVDVPDEIVVVPSVVADLTLLLAELLENATSFSPPHTRVTVTAGELRNGARLAVVDHGLGLPPDRLAEENARLTRRERLDLAPTEVLGLFVVGRLARRHGMEVTLTDTADGGLTAWVDLRRVHLIDMRPGDPHSPIHASVPHHSEFVPLLAASAVRSVPGSALPFDANVLDRATRTLQSARSWNAFIPVRQPAPELEAGPSSYAQSYEAPEYDQPVYDAEPVYGSAPNGGSPRSYRFDTPVAGRLPDAMPQLPVAHVGGYADTERPVIMDGPVVMSAPAGAIQLPTRRVTEDGYEPPVSPAPLRRRVPGSQLPPEGGSRLPTAPPSSDDALAAREAFEAFEAGVSRAQWDVIEADMSSPPAAGHPPLTRRVPGATLPVSEPMRTNPPANPAGPLDPDAARALIEQFEHGVTLALNETKPEHEGQPR
jgi:signal transduction histidine kinase